MDSTKFKNSITSVVAGDVIACITQQPNFHRLAWSYMEAAKMLVSHLEEDGFYKDVGIHPICFMYRHSLELTFKQIVWDGRRLLGEEGRIRELCRNHQIKPLWTEVEKIMRAVWPNEPDPEDATLASEVVSWFHEADERSFSFRYPFDQQQQPCLEGVRHINLTVLVEAMEITNQLLSGVAVGVSEYLSIQKSL